MKFKIDPAKKSVVNDYRLKAIAWAGPTILAGIKALKAAKMFGFADCTAAATQVIDDAGLREAFNNQRNSYDK